MIQILKKQGLKAALPLLLLATACGDGSSSNFQADGFDVKSSELYEEVVDADTSAFANLRDTADSAIAEAQNQHNAASQIAANVGHDSDSEGATKVPEPMTLAGLAIAALGLGTLKRKQSA